MPSLAFCHVGWVWVIRAGLTCLPRHGAGWRQLGWTKAPARARAGSPGPVLSSPSEHRRQLRAIFFSSLPPPASRLPAAFSPSFFQDRSFSLSAGARRDEAKMRSWRVLRGSALSERSLSPPLRGTKDWRRRLAGRFGLERDLPRLSSSNPPAVSRDTFH